MSAVWRNHVKIGRGAGRNIAILCRAARPLSLP